MQASQRVQVGPDPVCGCGVEGSGPVGVDHEPIACSLDASDMRVRVDQWRRILGHAVRTDPVIGGKRLVFGPDVPVGELAALAAAEQRCCRFFAFNLIIDRHGVALEVTAPPDAAPMVEMLFGP